MTDRELMQQALEALRFALHVGFDESSESQIKKGDKAVQQHEAAITALRDRLAQPKQSYPDNFIDALMYDVAKRDSEAQQAYEDAFVNGTGVMIGGKRIDPASIYKQPAQQPVTDHSCKDAYELIMKWADIYAAQTGCIYFEAAQDLSKSARMADERTMLACVVAQALAPQPAQQQEPVAWGMMNDDGKIYDCICPEEHDRVEGEYTVPLYTTPPQRKPMPPQSPCEMTQAEGKMFKLGWLECEAAHGIKGEA